MDQVDVFTSGPPQRPYVELGMIEAQQESKYSDDSMTEIIKKMRAYAGELGCDGLVIVSGNDAVVGSSDKYGGTVDTLKGYRGSCIVYTGPSQPPVQHAEPSQVCVPNATQLCYGPGACRGAQSCAKDGRGYTPCDCGSTPSATGQGDDKSPQPAAGTPQ